MTQETGRNLKRLAYDTLTLHALLQQAVNVELFTIPLYMTALYSLAGFYPSPSAGQALWPGMRPNAGNEDPNQRAFNSIFSVYVQEMLHLQLAANVCAVTGLVPKFPAPVYDGGSELPCVGDLSKIPGYEDVKVRLGPLDENQIKLFLAIETPDWDASRVQDKPAVPFVRKAGQRNSFSPAKGATAVEAAADLPAFGTIGHLYECIVEYMNLSYSDGETLWQKLYTPKAVQVDIFNAVIQGTKAKPTAFNHAKPEYPQLNTTIDSSLPAGGRGDGTPTGAYKVALEMIDAIVDQGEGSSAALSDHVPADDTPDQWAMQTDYDANDAAARAFWGQYSHFARFAEVAHLMDQIITWPEWRAERGLYPFDAADLLVAPDLASGEELVGAANRAQALNDFVTAAQVNNALNQSYSNMLGALERLWEQATEPAQFPLPAMQALYTRVATIWAAGGVPEFTFTTGAAIDPATAHACQGLDPAQAGKNICANAVAHTCAGSNSCANQGGCGYPHQPATKTSYGFPNYVSGAGKGGCGAPIPASQVISLSDPMTFTVEDQAGNATEIKLANGDNVYDKAWEVFAARFPEQAKGASKPQPSNLRLVLPPS